MPVVSDVLSFQLQCSYCSFVFLIFCYVLIVPWVQNWCTNTTDSGKNNECCLLKSQGEYWYCYITFVCATHFKCRHLKIISNFQTYIGRKCNKKGNFDFTVIRFHFCLFVFWKKVDQFEIVMLKFLDFIIILIPSDEELISFCKDHIIFL